MSTYCVVHIRRRLEWSNVDMRTSLVVSLVPSPPLPLTKWPRKRWSGIFGPIPWFSPSQIILANQIAAWSRVYRKPQLGSSSVAYAGSIKERLRVISYILAYEAHAWFHKHVIKRRSDWPKVFKMRRGEPRNGPKDTRPPFSRHFVSGSCGLGTRLSRGEVGGCHMSTNVYHVLTCRVSDVHFARLQTACHTIACNDFL